MENTWELVKEITQFFGMVALPLIAWVLRTIVKHGGKLAMLEEKVNDSVSRRLDSLENKVDGLETKIDNKMDKLEESIHQTQLSVTEKIIQTIHNCK